MTTLKLSTTYSFDYSILTNSIVECSNGDYLLAGRTFDNSFNSSAFAIRVEPNGSILWNKVYSSPFTQFITSITQLADGNFVATGSYFYSEYAGDEYLWIVKLDEDGEILWQTCIGNVGTQSDGTDICATSDGGFAVSSLVLKNNVPSTRVLKFDSENNIQWDESFNVGAAYSIAQTMDDGFILSGAKNIDGSLLSNIFILKLNSTGKKILEKVYTDYEIYVLLNSDIIETKNGNFALVAKSVIMELDSMGNILWSEKNSDYILNSIVETDDKNFAIAGSLIVNNYDHAYIAVLNRTTHEILWDNTEILYPSEINKLILNKAGYFTNCGYAPLNDLDSLGFLAIF